MNSFDFLPRFTTPVWAAMLALMPHFQIHAGPALNNEFDAQTRRAIQETKMLRFGGGQAQAQEASRAGNTALSQNSQQPVQLNNWQREAWGAKPKERKCDVMVGKVTTGSVNKGARQQNVTIVEGNVTNVCD